MTKDEDESTGSGPEGSSPSSEFDSADVFSLLGDETRLKVLSVLHDPATETPMTFSELYERIGADFTSGFNYHLDKLVPKFVSKTESGYVLTTFGNRVARAVAAETFAVEYVVDWFPVDGTCLACAESSLRARYEDETFSVECRACGEMIIFIQPPPNLVRGREADELVDAVDRWLHGWMRMSVSLARYGICDYCGGAIASSVVDEVEAYGRIETLLRFECTDCGEIRRSTVGALASQHPRVKAFHARREKSLRERRYWEVDQWISDDHLEISSRDPWRFSVSFDADGDACDVVVDGTPAVTDVSVRRDGDGR